MFVKCADTIENARKEVDEFASRFPSDRPRLFLAGERLDDGKILIDYNIDSHSIFDLVLFPSFTWTYIHVKMITGECSRNLMSNSVLLAIGFTLCNIVIFKENDNTGCRFV